MDIDRGIAKKMGEPASENPMPFRALLSPEGSLVNKLRLLQQPLPGGATVAGSVPLGGLIRHNLLEHDVQVGALRPASRHRFWHTHDGRVGSRRGCQHFVATRPN